MNLLITGAWNHTPEQRKLIEALGHTVIFMQNENEPLPTAYEDVEGVICNGLFLHHPIEKFTALRYVQVTSAGLDRIPVKYIRTHGISLHNAKGVYSIPMAEFALAGVLQTYKRMGFFYENQKAHIWDKHRGLLELHGKTVCILGCGDVGTECARRFGAFGCKVIGVNRTVRDTPGFDRILPLELLPPAAAEADVLIVSVALTEQTCGILDAELFGAMKQGCVLVNLSRGPIVDAQALLAALEDGKIYAVLDVFNEEPIAADSPLWGLDNVLVTPHNSFIGDGNANRLWHVVYKNLKEHRSHR